MKSFVLNLALAALWLFLAATPTLGTFLIGFLMGFALLAIFTPVLDSGTYVRRCLNFLFFLVVFTKEFLLANVFVARAVLFRSKESLNPNFVSYDVAGLSRFEILILSYSISLTPGTNTVQISGDFNTLIFHALDAECPDEVRNHIDRTLKRAILRFTR